MTGEPWFGVREHGIRDRRLSSPAASVLMSVRKNLGNAWMPARRLQPTFAALITGLAVAACGSVEETMIERGHPPAYAEGYAGGCASGKEAAGGLFAEASKDASRYDADEQYTEGWNDVSKNADATWPPWSWTRACATPVATTELVPTQTIC
jgi:hypothetical protein